MSVVNTLHKVCMVMVVVVVTLESPIGTHWLSLRRRMSMLGTVREQSWEIL